MSCSELSARGGEDRWRKQRRLSFTLVELLVVVLVIVLLIAIGLGVSGFVQRRMAFSTTKAQIAAIEAALETYKSDWGYYPPTTPKRISHNNSVEQTNNATLYRAMFNQSKRYLTFPKAQLHGSYYGSGYAGGAHGTQLMIYDVYNLPFNYYCSPNTPLSVTLDVTTNGTLFVTNRFTLGGQVNIATYDLFSYGRDHATFADPSAGSWPPAIGGAAGAENITWSNANSAVDDITNWGR